MGCDGFHYAILTTGGAITDESPVVHISPMDTGEPYAVLGTSFVDYLAVACGVTASDLERSSTASSPNRPSAARR